MELPKPAVVHPRGRLPRFKGQIGCIRQILPEGPECRAFVTQVAAASERSTRRASNSSRQVRRTASPLR